MGNLHILSRVPESSGVQERIFARGERVSERNCWMRWIGLFESKGWARGDVS